MTINYEYLVDSAMRVMIRDILHSIAAVGKLPGEHHFHISFVTQYDGVKIPQYVIDKYPQEMTIALQHQFSNLTVYDDRFSVELGFGGRNERLIIPFCAIVGFADPSENFVLQLDVDQTGVSGESSFHNMIGFAKDNAKEEEKPLDNVISFSEVKRLLNKH